MWSEVQQFRDTVGALQKREMSPCFSGLDHSGQHFTPVHRELCGNEVTDPLIWVNMSLQTGNVGLFVSWGEYGVIGVFSSLLAGQSEYPMSAYVRAV